MASTGVESQASNGKSQLTEVRVYPHSPILYWWVVWAYGFVCALLTYAQGETFTIGGGKPLLIYPGAWLGVSFTLLLLFVALPLRSKRAASAPSS
jgi:hypothetical protein